VELSVDLVDQFLVQVEQAAKEADDEQQVLGAVRQLVRRSFRVVQTVAQVLDVAPQRRHALTRLVADRGGLAHGIDASEALIEFARQRLPEADLRVGEMEALPYDDDTFDLVTGFNSFFFATDMVAALCEAGRVAKPGAPVVIQVWGRHERCDLEAMKVIARPFFPPRPPDAPNDPDLSLPGALEALAVHAGLLPEEEFDTTWACEYPDEETLGRSLVAVAGLAVAAGPERDDELKRSIADGLAAFRTDDGRYVFSNEYHFLIARA
jgi:SAM-dependent methyltransferase